VKKTLCLVVAAAVQARNGNHERAAALLQAASKADDLRQVIAHLGTLKSPAAMRPVVTAKAAAMERVRAAAWPFAVRASIENDLDQPKDFGADFRIDVESGLEDDLDLMGLDDSGGDEFEMASGDGFEFDGDEYLIESGADDEDEDGDKEEVESDADEDGDDDKEEENKAEEKKDKTEARRITAALANLAVLAAAKKKKKPAKKK
jgi:hypothetical protein